nr:NUDIX hydrolase [Neorhizobium tomejilense]
MARRSEKGLLQELAKAPSTLFARPFDEQNGAICYRRDAAGQIEVLLLTSRDTGRWVIPKGWPMKGKKSHRAAAIEAWEEAGVTGKVDKKPLGFFTYMKGLKEGRSVPVAVKVHLLRVEKLDETFQEIGQRLLEWVSPLEAARRVKEPELKSLLSSLERKLAPKETKH